jgi:hypothetical protein
LISAADQVNISSLTLQKQDSTPHASRQSNNVPVEFGIRTRVAVINDINNSSFNNTILGGENTPNYLNKIQSTSPSKSPNRVQPQVERVPIKQKEFLMRPDEYLGSPRKSTLSELES